MKRIISALALLTAASVSVAGCSGDDDDSATNSGGKGNTAGAPSNAGSPAAGDGSTGGANSGNVMCDPTQKGVCQNDMDCPFVADGTARITAGECGMGCLGKAATCTQDCMLQKLQMSSECATCYADTVNCTIMKCLNECLGAAESDACKQCQVDMGCRAAFDDCSGLPG